MIPRVVPEPNQRLCTSGEAGVQKHTTTTATPQILQLILGLNYQRASSVWAAGTSSAAQRQLPFIRQGV